MDFESIAHLVSSVGFPIVACLYMAYVNNQQGERHRSEMDKVTEAITELKMAITTLNERLRREED